MNVRITQKMIKELCGPVSFKRGNSFYRSNKVVIHEYRPDYCKAVVEGVENFYVTVARDSKNGVNTECSCPVLANFQKACQHTAAVLLAIAELQRQDNSYLHTQQSQQSGYGEITEEFMTLFQEPPAQKSSQQRYFEKRTVLDVQFTCKPFAVSEHQYMIGIELTVDKRKVHAIRDFLQNVKKGTASRLSAAFTYCPERHCFLPETDIVLHQLIQLIGKEPTVPAASDHKIPAQTLLIPVFFWFELVPLLEKAPLVMLKHGGHTSLGFQVIEGVPPLQFSFLDRKEGGYLLTIDGFEEMIILNFYQAVWYKGTVFQLKKPDCERLYQLKQMLASSTADCIPIPEEQADFFLEKVVPGLKKIGSVHLSNTLSQVLMKTPLIAKLYLDRLKNRLLAGLEFQYGNVVIQPLENRDTPAGPMVIRDLEKEEEILSLMEESGFSSTEGGYFMQNDELEYQFLYHVIPTLQQKVQLYATTAVRNRIVVKNAYPAIRVNLKKRERVDWLEFKFEIAGIADKQIKEVLVALEEKRKYYRLKNGALLSLETKEMEEIQRFLHAAPVQKKDFEASLNLPVSQSFPLLDSLEKSNVFTLEKAFRQFLDQLSNPNSIEVEVPDGLHGVLRDYQIHGYKWMKTLANYGFGGVLADDMGLGKTIQSIAFIVSELPSIRAGKQPVLIVCPSSVTYNWLDEMIKFAPELQAMVIDGHKTDREALYKSSEDLDVIITSYPLLRRDIKWYEKQMFHTVFFDEAQAFKNPVTQTARSVKRIKAEYRFGLTGTPVENAREELWSIFHVVFPSLFQGLKAYSHLSRKAVARRVRPFLLRRMKKEVLKELPRKNESLQAVEMLPAQKKLYAAYLAKLRHDTLKHLDQDTVQKNRMKILAGLTRLRQICCHPALFVDNYQEGSAKYEKLLEILEESRRTGRRVLVFSQFTKMLHLIGRELSMRGQSYFYLDGQTPSGERVEICNRFNNGENDLFLISLKAGGTGLNLTGADTVILYDLWWNPAVEEQAAGRAHRMGQKNEVEVIKLVASGTIEEKINQLQLRKKNLITEIIEPDEQASAALSEADIREILMI